MFLTGWLLDSLTMKVVDHNLNPSFPVITHCDLILLFYFVVILHFVFIALHGDGEINKLVT